MEPTALECIATAIVGIPSGLCGLAIIAYSIVEERKKYKYHRVRPEIYGRVDTYYSYWDTRY